MNIKKLMFHHRSIGLPSFLATVLIATALAIPLPSHGADQAKQLQKVIDFEGDVVEGMNKRSFESASQISEREKRKRKSHLYRKRAGFRGETSETIREMRNLQ